MCNRLKSEHIMQLATVISLESSRWLDENYIFMKYQDDKKNKESEFQFSLLVE